MAVHSPHVNLATVRNMSEAADPGSNSNFLHQALSTWLLLHCAGRSVRNLKYSGLQSSRDTCSSVRRKGPKYRTPLKALGGEEGSKDKTWISLKHREAHIVSVAKKIPRLDPSLEMCFQRRIQWDFRPKVPSKAAYG